MRSQYFVNMWSVLWISSILLLYFVFTKCYVQTQYEANTNHVKLIFNPNLNHDVNTMFEKIDKLDELWNQKEFIPSEKLHVFTFADNPKRSHKMICEAAATLSSFSSENHVLHVLGWDGSMMYSDGTPTELRLPAGLDARSKAFRKKFAWMTYLSKHYKRLWNIGENDLILFIDDDMLFQDDVSKIRDIYIRALNNKRGLLFNGDTTCYPIDTERNGQYYVRYNAKSLEIISSKNVCNLIRENAFGGGNFMGLNSGVYVADPISLERFFKSVAKILNDDIYAENDDQALAQRAAAQFPNYNRIVTDANSELSYLWYNGNRFGKDAVFKKSPQDFPTCSDSWLLPNGQPRPQEDSHKVPIMLHFASNQARPSMDGCFRALLKKQDLKKMPPHLVFLDADRKQEIQLASYCRKIFLEL